jgi:predicted PurR-regulated permease PerM
MREVLPDQYERSALEVFGRFRLKMRNWFQAQLALSALIGLVVGFGAWALGLEYPLVLGMSAALFELVPIVGPIITGAFAFLIAVTQSSTLGIYTVVFFVIIQQIENHLLTPLIMGKSVAVHPLMVIVSLLIGGRVGGFIGIVLAVPLAVLAQEIFAFYSEQKRRRAPQSV